jgi:hypothetical protein
MRNKIASEVELKFRHSIKEKELEIENLQEDNFAFKKKYDLLSAEYETFKSEAFRELEQSKDSHKAEIRDLLTKIQILNEKGDSNIDRETFKQLKNEAEGYRRNFADMQNELANLRKEKDILLTEKNEAKISLLKELESEKLKSSTINALNEKHLQIIKNLENEIVSLRNKLEDKNQENKILTNEKFTLLFDLKEKERDFESFKVEFRIVRQKIEERDYEIQENARKNNEKEKELFLAEKKMKEDYENKIQELTRQLKEANMEIKAQRDEHDSDVRSDKQHDLKRDYERLKRENDARAVTIEEDRKEIDALMERIKYMSEKEKENKSLTDQIKLKSEEIDNLNKGFVFHKEKQQEYIDKKNREHKESMSSLMKKKQYYKEQVKFNFILVQNPQ